MDDSLPLNDSWLIFFSIESGRRAESSKRWVFNDSSSIYITAALLHWNLTNTKHANATTRVRTLMLTPNAPSGPAATSDSIENIGLLL